MLFLIHALVVALSATTFVSAAAVDVARRDDNHLLVRKTSPDKNCQCKDVQAVDKVLSSLKASQYCSRYLGIKSGCTSTVTATATTTTVRTATITTTSAVVVPITVTATTAVTSVISVSSTSTQTITPPAVTTTITTSTTISATSVVSSTSTSTICTGIGVMKRDAEPTSPALEKRNSDCPPALKKFSAELIGKACKCYLDQHPITRTITVTKTATSTSSITTVVPSTTTSVVSTATITSAVQQTTSILTTETTTLIPSTVTQTITVSTTTFSTTTVIVPTTTSIIGTYNQVYSNSGCVYNEYTDYYVLAAPNFNDAQQQCACKCNQNPNCKSFFIYYSPPSGRFGEEYDCTNDNVPFNSAFVQCGVYFAAQGKAYNKVIST